MSCAHLHKACASFIARPSFVFMLVAKRDESYFRKQVSYAAGGGRVVRLHSFSWVFRCDSSPRHFCEPYSRFSGLHLGCRNGSSPLG